MQINITEQAKSDIKNIREYLSEYNKNAPLDFDTQLKNTFINLSVYPKIGRYRYEFSGKDIYTYVFKRYIIVYKLLNHELQIIRVLSSYQNDLDYFK